MSLVATVAALFIALFVVRPAHARAKVGRAAKEIEYRVLDAMLAGHMKHDDPALDELIAYSRLLSEHARTIGLTEATALMMAAQQCGISDLRDVAQERASYKDMSPEGRRIALEADKALHGLFAEYLVKGSKAWFLIAPARRVWRSVARRRHRHLNPHLLTPTDAATSYRRAVHDDQVRSLLDPPVASLA